MKSLILKWYPPDYLSGANHWRNNCVHHCIGDLHLTGFEFEWYSKKNIKKGKIKRKGNVLSSPIAVVIPSKMLHVIHKTMILLYIVASFQLLDFQLFYGFFLYLFRNVYATANVWARSVKVSLCYYPYCRCFTILNLSFVIVSTFISCMRPFQPFNGSHI